MIYLDYSATTPVRKEVMDSFIQASYDYIGNANSLHRLGMESRHLMDKAVSVVASIFQVRPTEVIFTSSASEANNMALKGVLEKYKNRGKRIATTKLEHSSILEVCDYLESIGYIVDYIPVREDGQILLENLEKVIHEDTVLVSIHHVNSEVGIVQDVCKIGAYLKEKYPKVFLHVDGTQSVGKIPFSLENIDLFTCSAHKFYGLKGIACLIKKQNVGLIPLIHGGKSQTEYRSGTPAIALMVSFAKALRLAVEELDCNYSKVLQFNQQLREELMSISNVVINSPVQAIPHILNISVLGIKPETLLHALEQEDIYISTKTACSKDSSASLTLLAMGKEEEISQSSIRISISHLTTLEELKKFLEILKLKICELDFRKEEK